MKLEKKARRIFLFDVERLHLAEKLMTLVMNLSFESLLIKLFVRNDFPVPLVPIRPVVTVVMKNRNDRNFQFRLIDGVTIFRPFSTTVAF